MNKKAEVGDMIDLLFMIFIAILGLSFISASLFFGVGARDQTAISDINEVSTIQDLVVDGRIAIENGLNVDVEKLDLQTRYVREYGDLPDE